MSASSDSLEVDKISANASSRIIINENVQARQYNITRITSDVYDSDPTRYLYSQAFDINDAGKIVGRIGCSGFIWDAGIITLKPSTLGDKIELCANSQLPEKWSEMSSINNNNFFSGIEGSQSLGSSYVSNGAETNKLDIPQTYIRKININGLTTGYSQELGQYAAAFVWDTILDITFPVEERITMLGNLGGNNSYALDINIQGTVVGSAEDPQGLLRAFTWTNCRVGRVQ